MELLCWFEKIRMPWLNELMLAVTRLGEETAFLVVALIVFWCVDKKRGYLLMSVGFIGTIANQFMKLWFRIPRPWVLDPNLSILEQARQAADGYSFPSGHTTSAVATFGSVAATSRRKSTIALCVLLAALVGISRMYVGVHTPADVLAGALTSLILILLLQSVPWSDWGMGILVTVMLLLALGFLVFVSVYPFPADVDVYNLEHGIKNAYKILGCILGLWVAYEADVRFIHFETKAIWWAQLLKLLLGLLPLLAIKALLKSPLYALFDGSFLADGVRYFLIVIFAGCIWPLSFKFWAKIGCKK